MLRQRHMHNSALNDQCQQKLALNVGEKDQAAKQAADHQERKERLKRESRWQNWCIHSNLLIFKFGTMVHLVQRGMSVKFDSRNDWRSINLERKPWIFEKLSFRELCNWKLSGLYSFDNMVIVHWVKNGSKTER